MALQPGRVIRGAAFGALLLLAGSLPAQIFVVYSGGVASYNFDGTSANPTLITGFNYPLSIAYSGGSLFVVDNGFIRVGEYTTAGATITNTLLTPTNYPLAITVSGDGSHLYVATTDFNSQNGKIEAYTSAGVAVNTSLITGHTRVTTLVEGGGNLFFANNGPINVFSTGGGLVSNDLIPGLNAMAMAVSGSTLFVSDGNSIGKYTTSGATVNATFLTGFVDYITDLTVVGGQLYIMNRNQGTIGVYNLDGTTVNAALITGLPGGVQGFAIAIPEPSTFAEIFGMMALAGAMFHRRRRLA